MNKVETRLIFSEKVSIFNKTVLNVLCNYISHEILKCNDKDSPWFISQIKSLLQKKVSFAKTIEEGVTLMITYLAMHKKGSFPLRISSVNVTKSTVSCGFGHIY